MTFRPPGLLTLAEAAKAAGVPRSNILAWRFNGVGRLLGDEVDGEPRFTAMDVVKIAVAHALASCGYPTITAVSTAFEIGAHIWPDSVILAKPDGVSSASIRLATPEELRAIASGTTRASTLVIPVGQIAARVREALV